MRIDFNSLAFNYSVTSGGNTPSWGTALGQGAGYKIKEGITFDKISKGMIYKAVSPSAITFTKGRGGRRYRGDDEDASLVIAAVFDKVYINDLLIQGGKFILLILKDAEGVHAGRLQLKYGLENSFTDPDGNIISNRDFKSIAAQQMGIAEDACWFVYNLSIENQDELHMRAIIVNDEGPMVYNDSQSLHAAWDNLIADDLQDGTNVKEEFLSNDYNNLEEQFKNWLLKKTTKKGELWAAGSVNNALNKLRKGFIKFGGYQNYSEFFEISEIKSFEDYLVYLNYQSGVKEFDDSENRWFSKGLIEYKEFLLSLSESSVDGRVYMLTKGDAINKIFFGVPGCGKSYHIEYEILGWDKAAKAYKNYAEVVRTTFYQDYSNTDFVGQILPKITKDENGKDKVEYSFNPGPFTLALIQAINNPSQKVALVIEEINRGNAPAIFGDIFQLLDRDENGISEYGIVNVNMMDYLNKYDFVVDGETKRYNFSEIKIPGNLDIFATMNTSDQNVYTLDTAFTRRWDKERISNEFNGNIIEKMLVPGMSSYTWGQFINAVNNHIKDNLESLQVNEDKQIGAFFIKECDLIRNNEEASDNKIRAFAYKVLEYLWDDVSKFDHSIIFNPSYKTFEELVNSFVKKGVEVFNNSIKKALEEGISITNQG